MNQEENVILKRLDMNKPSLTLLTTPSQKQTEDVLQQKQDLSKHLNMLEFKHFSGSINQIYKQIEMLFLLIWQKPLPKK